MADCCNVRTLSYISASLQLAGDVIVLILCVVFGALLNTDEFKNSNEAGSLIASIGTVVIVILGIVSAIAIAFLVTLIVGIKQNRVTLVSIYVYMTIVALVLWVLGIFISFVMGLVNKHGAGSIIIGLFINLLYVGIFILLFTPIFLLHRRMRNPVYQTENQGFKGNQPAHNSQQYGE